MTDKQWWDSPDLFTPGTDFSFTVKKALFRKLCEDNLTLHSVTVRGVVENFDQIGNICREVAGAHCIFNYINDEDGDACRWQLFVTPNGMIEVNEREVSSNFITIAIFVTNIQMLFNLVKQFQPLIKPHAAGHVKMLATGHSGSYHLMDVGAVNSPLVRENYTQDIVEGFDFIKEELAREDPAGRLALLDGNPGTGKSFFIRGLITDCKGFFVMIPSTLVGNLSGPDLLPCLLNSRFEADGPIVLILEDADASLVRREKGNFNQLSDLLNLGDGLLGELADIRILATTNAKSIEIDPAVLRPGRLAKHLEFRDLESDHADQVYKNLTGKARSKKGKATLAEIYRSARGDGWAPAKKKEESGQYL